MQDRDRNEEYRNEEYPSAFDYDDEEPEEESEPDYAPRGGIKLLTVIQISVSVAILVAALVLRVLGGEFFQNVRSWYVTTVNDSIIADEQLDQARRTVVDLWGNIVTAGPRTAVSSESGRAASSKESSSAQNSSLAASAQSGASQTSSEFSAQSGVSKASNSAGASE
jgi:hypothetical protein